MAYGRVYQEYAASRCQDIQEGGESIHHRLSASDIQSTPLAMDQVKDHTKI
jgi:hypothetical protein